MDCSFLDRLRTRIALKLLAWALASLPAQSWRREELARELADHREYERYEGYTLLMRGLVLPFHQWRTEWRGMKRTIHVRLLQMPKGQRKARTGGAA